VGEVGHLLAAADQQRLELAVDALELDVAGDQPRLVGQRTARVLHRAVVGQPDEPGRRGGHPLDRLGSVADLFDKDTGSEVLGHGPPLTSPAFR
jgi:hypothetical protein